MVAMTTAMTGRPISGAEHDALEGEAEGDHADQAEERGQPQRAPATAPGPPPR